MTAVPRILEPPAEVSLLTTGYELPADIPYQNTGGMQWADGLSFPYSCTTAHGLPGVCGQSDEVIVPAEPDVEYAAYFEPFIIEQVGTMCGWPTKPNAAQALNTVLHDADALAPAPIARNLWSGAYYMTTPAFNTTTGVYTNPTLMDAATIVTGGSTAQDPLNGIARLIEAVRQATGGKGGIIVHGTEKLVPSLGMFGMATLRSGRLLGPGFAYSPGPNNPSDEGGSWGPDGAAEASGEAWVYATGRVEWGLGPIWQGYNQSTALAEIDKRIFFDYKTNLWQVKLERLAIVRFNPCAVYAVKVRIPAPAAGEL